MFLPEYFPAIQAIQEVLPSNSSLNLPGQQPSQLDAPSFLAETQGQQVSEASPPSNGLYLPTAQFMQSVFSSCKPTVPVLSESLVPFGHFVHCTLDSLAAYLP